jgi:hypothetical protein
MRTVKAMALTPITRSAAPPLFALARALASLVPHVTTKVGWRVHAARLTFEVFRAEPTIWRPLFTSHSALVLWANAVAPTKLVICGPSNTRAWFSVLALGAELLTTGRLPLAGSTTSLGCTLAAARTASI